MRAVDVACVIAMMPPLSSSTSPSTTPSMCPSAIATIRSPSQTVKSTPLCPPAAGEPYCRVMILGGHTTLTLVAAGRLGGWTGAGRAGPREPQPPHRQLTRYRPASVRMHRRWYAGRRRNVDDQLIGCGSKKAMRSSAKAHRHCMTIAPRRDSDGRACHTARACRASQAQRASTCSRHSRNPRGRQARRRRHRFRTARNHRCSRRTARRRTRARTRDDSCLSTGLPLGHRSRAALSRVRVYAPALVQRRERQRAGSELPRLIMITCASRSSRQTRPRRGIGRRTRDGRHHPQRWRLVLLETSRRVRCAPARGRPRDSYHRAASSNSA
jgi:hypothetical protein